MRIRCPIKFQPFSHLPGTCMPLPFTTWELQAFPSMIQFRDLASDARFDLPLDLHGPVRDFTAVLNMEKGRIEIFGKAREGYFRLLFFALDDTVYIAEKNKEPKALFDTDVTPLIPQERLFLGVSKKQDWELVCRRNTASEIFPFWHYLAQLIPPQKTPEVAKGTYRLLDTSLEQLFQAGFAGILSPRSHDERHLGLVPNEEGGPAIPLLHEGAKRIRSLILVEEENAFDILPGLPKEFHSGRFLSPEIDLEWSKKQIKKVSINPKTSRTVHLKLHKGIRSFRHGKKRIPAHLPLELKAGKAIHLDRFEK